MNRKPDEADDLQEREMHLRDRGVDHEEHDLLFNDWVDKGLDR